MRSIRCAVACFVLLTLGAGVHMEGLQAEIGEDGLQRAGIPPRLLHADPVSYPADASSTTRHTCVISVVIGRDGQLRSAHLENTRPSPFDGPALESVQHATFSAASLNDRAVGARTQVWVEFRGDGEPALPTMDPGPNFERPRAIVQPFAEYTDAARRAGIRGEVLLSLIVTESGTVSDVEVLRHLGGGLDDEAVKTIQRWQFTPAKVNGEAVPDRIKTTMTFNIR